MVGILKLELDKAKIRFNILVDHNLATLDQIRSFCKKNITVLKPKDEELDKFIQDLRGGILTHGDFSAWKSEIINAINKFTDERLSEFNNLPDVGQFLNDAYTIGGNEAVNLLLELGEDQSITEQLYEEINNIGIGPVILRLMGVDFDSNV